MEAVYTSKDDGECMGCTVRVLAWPLQFHHAKYCYCKYIFLNAGCLLRDGGKLSINPKEIAKSSLFFNKGCILHS